MLTLFKNIKTYLPNQSIISNSFSYSYEILLSASQQFASLVLNGKKDLTEARVAFMVNPGFDYVKVQWAIWQAGGIAVPLCLSHPLPSLEYVIDDTEAILMIVSPQYENLLKESTIAKNIRLIVLGKEYQWYYK